MLTGKNTFGTNPVSCELSLSSEKKLRQGTLLEQTDSNSLSGVQIQAKKMKLNDNAYKNQQMHQSFYPKIEDRRFRKNKVSPIRKKESRDQCSSIISDILNHTPAKNLEQAKAKKQNLDLKYCYFFQNCRVWFMGAFN